MRRTLITMLAALLLAGTAAAQDWQEGVHYQRIEPAQPTDDPGRVEVVEVFGYACPHCMNFQPFIHGWHESAPEYVNFRRIPVVFRASWEPLARAYYAMDVLGILDEAHTALFDALHKQRMPLRTNQDIANFLAENFDVTRDGYLKAAESFAIETRLRRGMAQAQRFGITATPTVVVNGKYRATASTAGSNGKLIELIGYLVEQEADKLVETELSQTTD